MNVILKSKHLYKPFQLQCSFLSSSDLRAMKYKLFSLFKNHYVISDFIHSDYFFLENKLWSHKMYINHTFPCFYSLPPPHFSPRYALHTLCFRSENIRPPRDNNQTQKKKSSYNKIRQKSSYRGWTRKSSRRKTVSIASKRIRDTHFPIVRNFMKAPSQ